MTQYEISKINLGQSLDNLSNLDPRGYGVCNLLYLHSKKLSTTPLSINGAEKLKSTLKKCDVVFILTGFVLYPYNKAETDGAIGSILLAKTLYDAFNIKPVIICPKEAVKAVFKMAKSLSFAPQLEISKFLRVNNSLLIVEFTKDKALAVSQGENLINNLNPTAVISVECSGANEIGVYHNAVGIDVSNLQSKQDVIFETLKQKGVLNLSIGDLGNEIGMGAIMGIEEDIPYLKKGACSCGCGGGTKAKTSADNVITATISDWGAYALICAIAFVCQNCNLLPSISLYKKIVKTAVNNGLIDMYGEHIPKIDGIGLNIHTKIISLMSELVKSTISHQGKTKTWFDKIDKLNSFNK